MLEQDRCRSIVDAYVERCFDLRTAPRVSELAYELGVSHLRLARMFRGISRYMKQRQIARAQAMLRESNASYETIAAAAGFGTLRTFYRAFRRDVGVSPHEYRLKEMSIDALCK